MRACLGVNRLFIFYSMKRYLSLIKFSHTVFALPFAIIGFALATQENIMTEWSNRLFFLMLVCMVFARSAAMAFNRYLDRDIDRLNPRTAVREVPSGVISPNQALIFTIINSIGFVIATYFINKLCFILSPVALAIILGYSYTKRYTALCHIILGLGLALAPIGAYFTVWPYWNVVVFFYALAVLFWVSGFDIIYALQDREFDRENNLHSIPEQLGAKKALGISRIFHSLSFIFCGAAVYLTFSNYENAGILQFVGLIVFGFLLIFQQRLVKPSDLSKVNIAFFTANGVASVVFGGIIVLDLLF